MNLLPLALGLILLLGFFLACLWWESNDRSVMVVVALIALLVADVALYSDSADTQLPSIFNLRFADQGVRLSQVALPLAVAARLLIRGVPRRLLASAPLWLAFFSWIGLSAVVGLMAGHDASLVVRQLLLVPIVGGGMFLIGGMPASQFVHGLEFRRLIGVSAVVALGLATLSLTGITVTSNALPGLPLNSFGGYGADASTVFCSLGMIGLTLGLFLPQGKRARAAWLVPSVVLILTLFVESQRAARLGLFVGLLILVVTILSPTGRRRLHLSRLRLLFGTLLLTASVFGAVFVTAAINPWATDENKTTATEFKNPFSATNRQGSIQSRFNQWEVARAAIESAPLFGEGLGGTTVHYEEGLHEFVESDITHNIGLDLLRRAGLVSVLLAFGALAVLALEAFASWRRHPDNLIAALALAAFATTSGLLAKGMVESILEKDRLAALLALTLGLMVSAAVALFDNLPLPAADRLDVPADPVAVE